MAAESTSELVEAIKSLNEEQQAEVADVLAPHIAPTIGRRQMLGLGGATGLAALLGGSAPVAASQAMEPARAADGVLSDIDQLTSGDGTPMDFENAVTFDHEAVSSATTIGNTTYVYYDSSVAGFTITIPASLEARGGFLVFIDEGASVASNTVDVTSTNWSVDGQASSTIDANQSVYKLAANPSQSDWTSRIFTERLDARAVHNQNYVEPQVTASEGTSYNADLTAGNYHKVTMTGNVTFDFTNPDGSEVNSLMLHLVQDATGSRTPSFTPTVVWPGGSAPSWSTAANAEDVVTFVHDQDGSQWLGFESGLDFS